MRVAIFDTHSFEKPFFERANRSSEHELHFLDVRLNEQTATLACGAECVCVFVNDQLNSQVLTILKKAGVKLVALRSAGFNNVDLKEAAVLDLKVVRVPEYSPYAVAEHATALILALNRKITKSYSRVREGNFSLNNLVGFDLHGKTVGIIGTGRIGSVMAKIMAGFGCDVLLYDTNPDYQLVKSLPCRYVTLDELLKSSRIISLHVPLTPETKHMIDARAIELMRKDVMLINTGRGALIDTKALIQALKSGKIGHAGLDVYEEEEGVFFEDLSNQVLQDDILARLLTFPNVILTSHQAFLTEEALRNIAKTTLMNISEFEQGNKLTNEVCAKVNIKKSA